MPPKLEVRPRLLRWSIYLVEFMFVLVVIASVGALVTSAQNSSSNLSLNVGLSCNPYSGTNMNGANYGTIEGNISISGSYNGSIIHINGTAEMQLFGSSGQEYTTSMALNRYDSWCCSTPPTPSSIQGKTLQHLPSPLVIRQHGKPQHAMLR